MVLLRLICNCIAVTVTGVESDLMTFEWKSADFLMQCRMPVLIILLLSGRWVEVIPSGSMTFVKPGIRRRDPQTE